MLPRKGATAILMGSRLSPREDRNLENGGYTGISGIHPKGAPAMLMASRVFPTVGRNPGSTEADTTGPGPEGSPAVLMGSRVSPKEENAVLADGINPRVDPVLLMATRGPPCEGINDDAATTSCKRDAREFRDSPTTTFAIRCKQDDR